MPLYNGVTGGDDVRRPWIVGGLGLVGVLLTGAGLAMLSLPLALLTTGGLFLAGAVLVYFLSGREAAAASAAAAPSEQPAVPEHEGAPAMHQAAPTLPPKPDPAGSLHAQEYADQEAAADSAPASAEAPAVEDEIHGGEDAEAARAPGLEAAASEESEPPEAQRESRERPPAPVRRLKAVTASAATYQEGGMTAKHQLRLRIGGRRRL